MIHAILMSQLRPENLLVIGDLAFGGKFCRNWKVRFAQSKREEYPEATGQGP